MYCHECSAELKRDTQHCHKCGASVRNQYNNKSTEATSINIEGISSPQQKINGAKNLLFFALCIDMLLTAFVIGGDFWMIDILKSIDAGLIVADQSTIDSIDFWGWFDKLMLVTALGVGIALIRWLNACYIYAKETIGASGFKNEGWVTYGWIIPIFNLFKPYQVINEIYKAGSPAYSDKEGWKKESGSGLLLAWWIFWAVTHFILWIFAKQIIYKQAFDGNATLHQITNSVGTQAIFCSFFLIFPFFWFFVASNLTGRLIRKGDELKPTSAHDGVAVEYSPSINTRTEGIASTSPHISEHLAGTPISIKEKVSLNIMTKSKIDEDKIYAVVANELESGNTDKGLWTRLFADCEGDEKQLKVLYIKRRAEKLIAAELAIQEQLAIKQADLKKQESIAAEKAEKLRLQNAGLADPELVTAVRYGNWSYACSLLKNGVSPLGSDESGQSLLDLAGKRGDRQIIDLLKTYGAGIVAP